MAVVEADSTWRSYVKGGRWTNGWQHALAVEYARLTVWSPLLLVIGIWGYFSLAAEPPGLLAMPCVALAVGFLLWPKTSPTAKVIAIIALGFACAQLRTQWIATPLVRAYSPGQTIEGRVADVDVRSKSRFTLVLEITKAQSLPETEIPKRVLVTITGKHKPPRVGDEVSLIADLAPLPRPAQPSAFDYGRQLYFQSIGAMGRSKVAPIKTSNDVSWRFKLRRAFHDLRSAIGSRVKQAIPGPIGSFADALITGERASIPRDMNTSLQVSGLFHILSISGLHMALVAGGAFWALRAGLALSPQMALRWPIKKWAAAFAIVIGALYMFLADSGAATERSFIMIAVVFFAVLVDRPALSLQNLSLAAVVILLREPEQALAASFQMSFMAVMGLAAFFNWWQRYATPPGVNDKSSIVMRWGKRVVLVAVASLATSLVAGVLSGIPAAHHFGRVAPYSVVSNALALPIVSFLVMPAAMTSVLLMPLGLETLPLKAMGWGLQIVMLISDWVASWPAAGLQLPRLPVHTAAALSFAMALALIPVTRLRFLSLPVFLVAAIMVGFGSAKPIILMDERGGNAAIQTDLGLVPAVPKAAAASVSRWMDQAGDSASFKDATNRVGWRCDAGVCLAEVSGLSVAFLPKQASPTQRCPKVDVLLSQEPLRRHCKGLLATVDRFDVWRSGAHAVYADGSVQTTKAMQGQRPWVYEPRARNKP
jgi:competence protein ComEC